MFPNPIQISIPPTTGDDQNGEGSMPESAGAREEQQYTPHEKNQRPT